MLRHTYSACLVIHIVYLYSTGAWGSVVVNALRYMSGETVIDSER